MKTSDFYYELPKELIAQTPSAVRSESRLMVYSRADHTIEHRVFRDIVDCAQYDARNSGAPFW